LRDLEHEQARVLALNAELMELVENPPILTLGEAIDALAEDRKPVANAVRDRETQRLLAAQRAAAMVEEGRRLRSIWMPTRWRPGSSMRWTGKTSTRRCSGMPCCRIGTTRRPKASLWPKPN
jgi:hypothetical protein